MRVAVKISRELLVINGIDHYLLSRILHMLELEPDDARHSSELMTMLARGIKVRQNSIGVFARFECVRLNLITLLMSRSRINEGM